MACAVTGIAIACRLVGAWALINGAGWIADAPGWATGGPLGWDLHRWQRRRLWRGAGFAVLFGERGLALLGLGQAGLGLWLVLGGGEQAAALALLGLIGLAQALRGAGNGADKMAQIVVAGTLLQVLGARGQLPVLATAGVVWTGGQLTLAYWAAGMTKARLAPWRDGRALHAALASHSWGAGWAARATRNAGAARALAWAVFLPELAFPLALLLPAPALAAVLAGFALFHLAIALVMGLNTYPLAFVAAYPATLLLGADVRAGLGLG